MSEEEYIEYKRDYLYGHIVPEAVATAVETLRHYEDFDAPTIIEAEEMNG